MATSSSKISKEIVGGKHVSVEELDNLRDAVCLLNWKSKDKSKQWSGYGFYANVKTKKHGKTLDVNCIITTYDDIFLEVEELADDMVAVFHHESDKKEAFELPLANSWTNMPYYSLIFVDESKMKAKGVKPILADSSHLPVVLPHDKVYMIHHPGKMKNHYSEDKARLVTKVLIEYYANTLQGPPGSPVFVLKDSKFLLVAMHCNEREGVLVSHILDHLHIPSVLSKLPEQDMPRELEGLMAEGLIAEAAPWEVAQLQAGPPIPVSSTRRIRIEQQSVDPFSLSDDEVLDTEIKAQGAVLLTDMEAQSAGPYRLRIVGDYKDSYFDDQFSVDYTAPPRVTFGGISWWSSDDEGTKLKEIGESKRSPSDQISKTITVDGGAIETDDLTFTAGLGCLAENTDIIVERVDRQFDILKSLLDLGLVHAAPRVVEFSPGGLEFSKPVDLAIKFEKTATDSERFILHGFYNPIYQKIIWELVTNGVEENDEEGVIHAKIISFSLYMFILSTRGKLARIISHLNHSFTCLAYSFFRRSPSKDTIDIAVVLVSEFFDDNKENNIKHLLDERFVKGEKGVLKRVDTDHPLEMCLHFPGIERPPYGFQVDQSLLDSVGFVIDHFKKITVTGPANGEVKISEKNRGDENESLWILNVIEKNEEIQAEVVPVLEQSPSPEIRTEGQSPSLQPSTVVVNRTTKLTNKEMTQMSREVGIDWDNLAALMDIPYREREEIRVNYGKYPSFSSKAKQVLNIFNGSECFDRATLVKYLEELKRLDLKKKMLPMNDQSETEKVHIGATATSQLAISEVQPEISEVQLQNDTPLSSREMHTLSQHLVVTWDRLSALLGITPAERDDIRYSLLYTKSHSKAEKMLAIFNDMEDFSRQKLAECLEEIGRLELKEPVITGKWRK